MCRQYGDYFARLHGPVFFVYAVVTMVLNSMQVRLAVDQVASVQWPSLWPSFRYFTAIVLVGAAILSTCFIFLWWWLLLDEWIYCARFR
jgi:hypothetical protein